MGLKCEHECVCLITAHENLAGVEKDTAYIQGKLDIVIALRELRQEECVSWIHPGL